MHLQSFFFLVLLASIFQSFYSASSAATPQTITGTTTEGWDWNKNYKVDDDKYNDYYKKPSYKDRDNSGSYDKKPSYKDGDDSGSYENKPSYKDDDDYKPSKQRYRKSPDDLGHMNIYVREPSKDGRKRKPKRFRFPVARYERERFPSFGPLISFLPWLPIFADRITKQTFIYSPTGGVYIIPPLINFYGKLISVAELIAAGYASLVSTGVPPPPAVDIAPLVQPGPVVGHGVPTINPATGGFKGGIRTEYDSFVLPKYPKVIDDYDGPPQRDQGSSSSGKSNYRSRPSYGDKIAADGY